MRKIRSIHLINSNEVIVVDALGDQITETQENLIELWANWVFTKKLAGFPAGDISVTGRLGSCGVLRVSPEGDAKFISTEEIEREIQNKEN